LEPPAGEPFLKDAKPVAIVAKDFYRGPPAVEENKDGSAKGIGIEHLTTQARQAIDAVAKVHRLCAGQNAHMGSDLDHRL
jgi:hypothetical protein